jgi:hypothetical protein
MSLIHTPEERQQRIADGLPYAIAPVEALRWHYENCTMPPKWLLAPIYFALAAVVVLPDQSIMPAVATN